MLNRRSRARHMLNWWHLTSLTSPCIGGEPLTQTKSRPEEVKLVTTVDLILLADNLPCDVGWRRLTPRRGEKTLKLWKCLVGKAASSNSP